MKKCEECGDENSDEATQCAACHATFKPVANDTSTESEQLLAARRFWEQMTFRGFSVFWLKLQGLWLIFYGIISSTYIVEYLSRMKTLSEFSLAFKDAKHYLFWYVVRFALYIVAGFIIINKADRLLDWIVKDLIKEPGQDS